MNGERPAGSFKRLAKSALRAGPFGEAVRRIAALRGRSLVLVYHRVTQGEPLTPEVVPFVPSGLFRRQLEALAEVGEIAPLETLLQDRDRHAKPRFALTFDDDYATHVDHALPVLEALEAPATFFLSGRALHGLGSYRFEAEGNEVHRHLGRGDIEALSGAGMAVGFHTLHHEILTRLDEGELEAALTVGRKELEEVVGRPLLHFAYPYGKADRRTADRVRDAGFDAAWTGRPQAMRRRDDDRYLLGRWEPGRLHVDDFLVGIAIRLTRAAQP